MVFFYFVWKRLVSFSQFEITITSASRNVVCLKPRWAKGGVVLQGARESVFTTKADHSFFTEPVSCLVFNAVGKTNVSILVDVHCELLKIEIFRHNNCNTYQSRDTFLTFFHCGPLSLTAVWSLKDKTYLCCVSSSLHSISSFSPTALKEQPLTLYFSVFVSSWSHPVGGAAAKNSGCGLWCHPQLQMGWKPSAHSHLVQKRVKHGEEPKSPCVVTPFFFTVYTFIILCIQKQPGFSCLHADVPFYLLWSSFPFSALLFSAILWITKGWIGFYWLTVMQFLCPVLYMWCVDSVEQQKQRTAMFFLFTSVVGERFAFILYRRSCNKQKVKVKVWTNLGHSILFLSSVIFEFCWIRLNSYLIHPIGG